MKRIFVALLIVFGLTQAAYASGLDDLGSRLRSAREFKSVSLVRSRNVWVGRLWAVTEGVKVNKTLWFRVSTSQFLTEFAKGWVTDFSRQKQVGEVVQQTFALDRLPSLRTIKSKKDFEGSAEPDRWLDAPLRLFMKEKDAESAQHVGTREAFGQRWAAYRGACDLGEMDTSGKVNTKRGSFEILVRSDNRSWVEIYYYGDGQVMAARQGWLDIEPSDKTTAVSPSTEELVEEYTAEYRKSAISSLLP